LTLAVVLGGAGFVGSNLTEHLLNRDYEVIVIDKLIHKDSEMFLADLKGKNLKFIELDLCETQRLIRVLPKDIDVVFHLAANSDIRQSEKNPKADFRETLFTSLSLAEMAKTKKISQLVFASTSAIYGYEAIEVDKSAHKSNPLFPVSNYGVAKLASEYIFEAALCRGIFGSATICRFPNVVGRNATHGILYDFFVKRKCDSKSLQVLGNGSQNKPYLHVSDLVQALERISHVQNNELNFRNLGPMDTISVKNIVELFLEITGWEAVPIYGHDEYGWQGDVPRYSFAIDDFSTQFRSSKQSIELAVEELMIDKRFAG
jgi:UDP-glucose 4-epimerase